MPRVYSDYSYFDAVIFSPGIPEDLKLDQIGDSIRLSWLDSTEYEDGFVVERKIYGGSWESLYYVDKEKDFFVDYGPFIDGQIYYYRVKSYLVLSNQHYLVSAPSNIAVITFNSSIVANNSNIIEIEFNQTDSLSIDIQQNARIYIKNSNELSEYLWFLNGDCVSLTGKGEYADIIPLSVGTGVIIAKTKDSSQEAILNITITQDEINENPTFAKNLRLMQLNNSSIRVLWNYDSNPDPSISHFYIYRIEKTGSSSKHNLIDFSDLSKNRIGTVSFDNALSIYSFDDNGLKSGTSYIYTVVAISKYNKSSLYVQNNQYDYVGNKKYVIGSSANSDIEIDPSVAYVSPGSGIYLGILNPSNKVLSPEWEIEDNVSDSLLKDSSASTIYFEASDKSISKDSVVVRSGQDIARAKVIVTEVL